MLNELSTKVCLTHYSLCMCKNTSNLHFLFKKNKLLAVDVVYFDVILFGAKVLGLSPNTSAKSALLSKNFNLPK